MKTNPLEVKKMVTYHLHEEVDIDLSSVAPPRISFSSSEFLDEDFISINPKKPLISFTASTASNSNGNKNGCDFEFFFSGNNYAGGRPNTMLTADDLFYDGKLLPFWQNQRLCAGDTKKDVVAEEVKAYKEREEEIVVAKAEEENTRSEVNGNEKSGNKLRWYFDEDPSPRPPKCTVLWKELLRLKKQRASLSPSSSSSSTSSSSSSMADATNADNKKGTAGGTHTHGSLREVYLQRIRKGLERTKSGSIRIRPILNVPACTHHVRRTNSNGGGLPPMFPTRKGRSV